MRAVTDLQIKKRAVGSLSRAQSGGGAFPPLIARSLPFFVYVYCLAGARALCVRDVVVVGANNETMVAALAAADRSATPEAAKKQMKPPNYGLSQQSALQLHTILSVGNVARTRTTWLLWLLPSICAAVCIFFTVVLCLCSRGSSEGSSRQLQRKEESFPHHRASLLSVSRNSSGAFVPLPPLRMGWVPRKECCLTVFREWLATHRDSTSFKVKNLEDNKIPMQATVLYTARRLTMFAEPQCRSPCCFISPPAQQLAGKDPMSSTPVLEVREHDGSLYAILEVEARGAYSLRRGGMCLMTIDSSGGNLVVVSGTVQIGKVTCRAWERIEGELVEIWTNAGIDATVVVGVVLAVLLLCDGDAQSPKEHETLSPRPDAHEMSLAPSQTLPIARP